MIQYPVAGLVLLGIVASLCAAEKKLPIEQTSNELIDISATALLDRDQIRQELGSDLGADIVLVRVTVRPVSDKPIQLTLDDFLLVSSKDGQRSEPYAPSQIAGSAALVVTPSGTRNGGPGSNPKRSCLRRHRWHRWLWRGRRKRWRNSKPRAKVETLQETRRTLCLQY